MSVQFYINSRPVPKAVAWSHVFHSYIYWNKTDVNMTMNGAVNGIDKYVRFLNDCGVSVHVTK